MDEHRFRISVRRHRAPTPTSSLERLRQGEFDVCVYICIVHT